MIPAAPFDYQTREALKALARLADACIPPVFPCGKGDCEKCESDRRVFWEEMGDMADEDALDDAINEILRGDVS